VTGHVERFFDVMADEQHTPSDDRFAAGQQAPLADGICPLGQHCFPIGILMIGRHSVLFGMLPCGQHVPFEVICDFRQQDLPVET
jgi:hypothetical protein